MKRLSDIGERAAIERIVGILTKAKNNRGIGDDCAAIDFGDEYLLVTTDMISQQTHIPSQMTPYQMGWFIVAVNLSDIAAKGGRPLGLVLSFGLPKHTSEEFLSELARGANACSDSFGTTIVGGDTKETSEITLCGTAFGLIKKDHYMSRIGARPGDILAVTGILGKAGAGFYALKQKKIETTLSKALLEPVPRLREGQILAQQKQVTSCMDLSDGLSASLYQLQQHNTVGFELEKHLLPVASELVTLSEENKEIDPFFVTLHFGGDYQLLLTVPSHAFEQLQHTMRHHGFDLINIGRVTEKKEIVLVEGNERKILENKGFEHFKNPVFS